MVWRWLEGGVEGGCRVDLEVGGGVAGGWRVE